jgi:hypothetical protein
MNLSQEIPPVYEQCRKQFGVNWDDGIIITYGDTIHYKFVNLPRDFIVHEETHVKQQMAMGKELWWEKYFADEDFRLSQEVEAYRAQWKFIKNNYDRNLRKKREKTLCQDMARIYGGIFTEEEAHKLIME